MSPTPIPLRPLAGLLALAPLAPAQVLHQTWTINGHVSSVHMDGDFDGDGLPDILVGLQIEGKVYCFSGVTSQTLWTLTLPGAFGAEVSTLPDLDGDGTSEIVSYVNNSISIVRPSGVIFHQIPGSTTEHAYVGDVNGDTYPDLAVAFQGDTVKVYSGRHIATGSGTEVLWTVNGPAGGWFGNALCSVSDVDGDGFDDIAVSSPQEAGQQGFFLYKGRVRLLSGATGATIWTDTFWDSAGTGADFLYGRDMDTVEDMNGDGIQDLLVGISGLEDDGPHSGGAWVISGASGATLLSIGGSQPYDNYGWGVSAAGDSNSDGTPDLLVASNVSEYVRLVDGSDQSTLLTHDEPYQVGGIGMLDGGVDVTGDTIPDFVIAGTDETNGLSRVWLYRGDCPGGIQSYCTTSPNSYHAVGGEIRVFGSVSIFANDMILQGRNVVPNQPGVFYFGDAQLSVPFGDGVRCVGGTVQRIPPIQVASPGGIATLNLDLTTPPFSAGPTQVTPGSAWNFQYWFRDPGAGGSGFNLTDGVSVTFCP